MHQKFFGGDLMSFWEGAYIASVFWLIICGLAFMRGMMWSFDNRLNWGDGFNSGWDAAIEAMTEIAKKKGEQENGGAD